MILARALVLVILVATTASSAFAATGATWLGSDAITRIARDWLLERMGPNVDPSAVELAGMPRELLLPAGDVAFAPRLQSGSVEAGAVTVLVEAVVTVRELGRRAVITAGDVRVERRALSRLPVNAVHDSNDVIGREVTRPLAPGEVVTAQSVTAPLIIRRGSVVSVVVEGSNFKIVARGVAVEDGAHGAPIRVLNAASRREVVGRVEDERTVRIPF